MRLMALSWTIRRSDARRAVARSARCVLDATRILMLATLLTLLGVVTLAGCSLSNPTNQATANDVKDRTFTFTSGAVFNSALANVSTALAFSGTNAESFTLCSGSSKASGTNRFGSCLLTVTTSTYGANAGPQLNDVITLDPCDFDSDTKRLIVSNRGITATSAAATLSAGTGCETATQTLASEVNNQRFTFLNGGVFHPALNNVQTALGFSNNAQQFTLTSAGVVSGTAMGTSSVTGSGCRLTVTTSSYNPGPQKGAPITLTPCLFNSTNNTLTVTNLGITETSERGQLQ